MTQLLNKKCTKCNIVKFLTDFPRRRELKSGRMSSCKKCKNYSNKIYKNNHKEEESIRNARWYLANKEHKDAHGREWSKNNLARKAELRARRRATKINQTPNMTREELGEIADIYKKCKEISLKTGIKHEVDHIMPLSKGGLHHPNNLQILTRVENRRKSDKLIAD